MSNFSMTLTKLTLTIEDKYWDSVTFSAVIPEAYLEPI